MAITARETIKSWFRTRMKPTQEQFAAWLDSFVHKEDLIQMAKVDGLTDALNGKSDSSVIESMQKSIASQQLAISAVDKSIGVERSRAVQAESDLLGIARKVYDTQGDTYMVVRVMTQSQYDALDTKDDGTIYLIKQ